MSKNGTSFLQKIFPSRIFIVIGIYYLIGLLIFMYGRGLFIINLLENNPDAHISLSEYFYTLLHGIQFDQAIILTVLLPLLLVLPWVNLTRKPIRYAVTAFLTICYSAFALLILADIRFYSYFDSHLNYLSYEYVSEGNYSLNLVYADPKFWKYIGLWAITTIITCLILNFVSKLTNQVKEKPKSNKLVWTLIVLTLFFLGIRGRTGQSSLDWGEAYFTDNRFANQSVLNGVYTLARSFDESYKDPRLSFVDDSERFPFMPTNVVLEDIKKVLFLPGDSSLSPATLKRVSHSDHSISSDAQFRPNIVIVLMESWRGDLTSSLGCPLTLTPYFDSLTKQGIFFRNFFANGFRTNYGIGAVVCSYPALPGRAILKRYDARHPFITLSELLHEDGYYNMFYYGGDLAFDNMEGFLRSKKYDRFIGDDNFDSEDYFSKWGVPDHLLFQRFIEQVDSLPRPYQATILTLSNHEPFDLPDSSVRKFYDDSDSSKQYNAQLYADFAVGSFIEQFKKHSSFDSTIFLFVSDHARLYSSPVYMNPGMFHIPLLIYSPAILGDSTVYIDKYGSQVDIVPTLMGLLKDRYVHESWGRDLLALEESDKGFAVTNLWRKIAWLDSDYLYVEDSGQIIYYYQIAADSIIQKQPDSTDINFLQRQAALRAYTQLADQLSIFNK